MAGRRRFSAERVEAALFGLHAALVYIFLLLPVIMAMALSVSASPRIQFPPQGFSWRWYAAALANADFVNGLWISTVIALATALLSAVAGTGAAIAINHYRFRGRAAIQAMLGLPLALPAVVIGLGLLFVMPSYGLRPGMAAAVLSHSVIGSAYVAYLVLASFANYDMTLERASLDLGASRSQTFRFITLPIIRPGVVAGAAFAFLISFDNVSLSLFVTRGDTLPLRLMQHIQFQPDPTVAAASTLLVGISLVFLVLFFRVLSERQLHELTQRRPNR